MSNIITYAEAWLEKSKRFRHLSLSSQQKQFLNNPTDFECRNKMDMEERQICEQILMAHVLEKFDDKDFTDTPYTC